MLTQPHRHERMLNSFWRLQGFAQLMELGAHRNAGVNVQASDKNDEEPN